MSLALKCNPSLGGDAFFSSDECTICSHAVGVPLPLCIVPDALDPLYCLLLLQLVQSCPPKSVHGNTLF